MLKVSNHDLLFVRNAKNTKWAAHRAATNKGDQIFLVFMAIMTVLVMAVGIVAALMGIEPPRVSLIPILGIGVLGIPSGYFYAHFVFHKNLMKSI